MYKAIVVDDERIIRMGIQKMLPWLAMGIDEVYAAASGREALEIIEQKRPDIMVTDINMTEMSGLELIEKVTQVHPEIKILVLTGYDNFEYARKCLRMQVKDFFLKPIDEEVLSAAILKLVHEFDDEKRQSAAQTRMRRIQGTTEQMQLEGCLRDLVHGRDCEGCGVDEAFAKNHLDRNASMQVAILMPEIYREKDAIDENFTTMSIKNISMDMLDANGYGITFSDDDGKIVLVLLENEDVEENIENLKGLIGILKDEYEFSPKVVLGSQIKGLDQLRISYNDAVYLLDYEKDSICEIVRDFNSENKSRLFNEIFSELKNAMVGSMGNTDYINKVYRTFGNAIHSYNLAHSAVRLCCVDIASALYFTYIGDAGEKADSKLGALFSTLLNADRDEAYEYTGEFIQQLISKEEENVHEIISKAKGIIEDGLSEDLTVSRIAEALFVTPNYFSRLFKKVTGEGCNEYIVRKRIEKAKSLLETTSLKTGKIAFIVGYHDTNYFSLAFKKHTGTSPTKYRESIRA